MGCAYDHNLIDMNKKSITKYQVGWDFGNHSTLSLVINVNIIYQDI